MEAKDFEAWINHMGWSDSKVARELDLSRNTVIKYKQQGAPASIGYACAAIAYGLPPWADMKKPASG